MDIESETRVLKIRLSYNHKSEEDTNAVYSYLDDRFGGREGYKVIRKGGVGMGSKGLMIVEVK